MPVQLYAQCEGVACDADTTCDALGKCIAVESVSECSGPDCFSRMALVTVPTVA